jgi:hypothetical protein
MRTLNTTTLDNSIDFRAFMNDKSIDDGVAGVFDGNYFSALVYSVCIVEIFADMLAEKTDSGLRDVISVGERPSVIQRVEHVADKFMIKSIQCVAGMKHDGFDGTEG